MIKKIKYSTGIKTIASIVVASIITFVFFYLSSRLAPYYSLNEKIPILLYKTFISSLTGGVFVSSAIISIAFLSYKYSYSWGEWKVFRPVVVVCVSILIWGFAFSDVNYYFDNFFLFDRLFLVGLGIICVVNPYFLIVFTMQAFLMAKQFGYPLVLNYSFTDKQIIFQILVIFWVLFTLKRILFKKLPISSFLITALAAISNWYFLAGIGKMQIEWIKYNNLQLLFATTIDFGWLSWVNMSTLKTIGYWMNSNKELILYPTIVIELIIPIILLYRKKTLIIGLVFYILFHTLVFVSSGIFFWKWACLEAIILLCIQKKECNLKFDFSTYVQYLIVLVISYFCFNSTKLAWIDSGLYQKTSIYLVDNNGERRQLGASFFAPFDLNIAQNRFNYLSKYQLKTSTYGSSKKHISKESIDSLHYYKTKNYGLENSSLIKLQNKSDSLKTIQLLHFIKTFVSNKITSTKKVHKFFTPPHHIYQSKVDDDFPIYLSELNEIQLISSKKNVDIKMDVFIIDEDTLHINLK